MNQEQIRTLVHDMYWGPDKNCAATTMTALSQHFGVEINPQVWDAVIGMHGAGGFGAQCGLVEGALLFIGIYGKEIGFPDERIIGLCRQYAGVFSEAFGSLLCSVLRPEGFSPDNPPHICEGLTNRTILFAIGFVEENMKPAVG